eukprot:764318-Hanusia_phi.AAC.1
MIITLLAFTILYAPCPGTGGDGVIGTGLAKIQCVCILVAIQWAEDTVSPTRAIATQITLTACRGDCAIDHRSRAVGAWVAGLFEVCVLVIARAAWLAR